MAEDDTWPSIKSRGLLSTNALVDLFNPDTATRNKILTEVRQTSITLVSESYGSAVIRDQRPLKFLEQVLLPNTSPQQFLDALNGRVFFWLSLNRLSRLLNARLYRNKAQTVLHVNTAALIARYGNSVQLAPYNTGSMHVPNSPPRGADVFVDLDDYPYEDWAKKRGTREDAVVELIVPYSVPDILDFIIKVERWQGGAPVEVLFEC